MEALRYVLTTCSGILFFAAFAPYILSIIRGVTKPVKVTWIIWASLDTITITGMYFENSLNGQIIGAMIGAWTVVVLALVYGKSGWDTKDKLCLGGALSAIILWKIFDSPVVGIVVSSSVVFFSSFPTFGSAWREPENEDKIAWLVWWLSCVCAVISLPSLRLADSAQPLTFFTIESIMMYILYVHHRRRRQCTPK